MSIAGKKGINFTKADLASQKNPIYGLKKLKFYHKATLGDTTINLASLVLPSTELPSVVNPSASELASANLLFNKNNFVLISSVRGLMDFDSYQIVTNTTINLTDSALANEIFIGIIDNVVRTGAYIVDAAPLVATGTLAATQTDFNVGTPFDTNKYPAKQIGAVLVFIDGVLQFRNVGNATAAPGADGNYEELAGLNNTSTVIRFNVADAVNSRAIVVVSNGLLAYAPNDSMMATISTLSGTVDRLVSTTAVLAGVPTTDFQAQPSQPDLTVFGDRVLSMETSYPASKVYGRTDGVAVPAGKIGETIIISRTYAAKTAIPATGVAGNVIASTLNLTAGKWEISGAVGMDVGGVPTITDAIAFVSTTSATFPGFSSLLTPDSSGQMGVSAPPTCGTSGYTISIPPYELNINTTNAPLYLGVKYVYSGGSSLTMFGYLKARRIA